MVLILFTLGWNELQSQGTVLLEDHQGLADAWFLFTWLFYQFVRPLCGVKDEEVWGWRGEVSLFPQYGAAQDRKRN
ncbi:hypothetical protein J6590_091950 [Homalodisca vitripennis]|nr:hypothetical protein J6590_091950 [Homalodisca vitripennis]